MVYQSWKFVINYVKNVDSPSINLHKEGRGKKITYVHQVRSSKKVACSYKMIYSTKSEHIFDFKKNSSF